MYRYLSTPGASNEQIDLFCGEVESTQIDGIHGLAEENEDIRASVWNLDEALALLQQGRVCNSMTLVALQWLAVNHLRLTAEWTKS